MTIDDEDQWERIGDLELAIKRVIDPRQDPTGMETIVGHGFLLLAEMISHQTYSLAPPARDEMAEFTEFAERYIARRGQISEKDMRGLYEDFRGIKLEPGKGRVGK